MDTRGHGPHRGTAVVKHDVKVVASGMAIAVWTEYSISNDMLSAADDFSLTVAPMTREIWQALAPDSEVQVFIDGTRVLSGFIDDRVRTASKDGGSLLRVSGRDRGGRLVDESMDLTTFSGLTLRDLAKRISAPWFDDVVFSNADNRTLVRGRKGRKAAAYGEPTPAQGILEKSKAPKKVEPGEQRWSVLAPFLEAAQLLAWSSADGKHLIVGKPNYQQEAQFSFLIPARDSLHPQLANVEDYERIDSVADRYSSIRVVGASRGNARDYGRSVTARTAVVTDGSGPDGTGKDFRHRKNLIIADDDIRNTADAEARARREMLLRNARGQVIKLTVPGHSQRYEHNAFPTLFAFDTIAEVIDEEIGERGRYLITDVEFTSSKSSGAMTRMTLVPEGTELTQ